MINYSLLKKLISWHIYFVQYLDRRTRNKIIGVQVRKVCLDIDLTLFQQATPEVMHGNYDQSLVLLAILS